MNKDSIARAKHDRIRFMNCQGQVSLSARGPSRSRTMKEVKDGIQAPPQVNGPTVVQ
jgi:hypothetical protein